ncbi:hypothetical protein V6N13_032409 [Hibiscus sabdariffa]
MHKGAELENQMDTNILVEAGDVLTGSPREAIDFMGTFNKNCNSSSINSTRKFDSSPYLDLSLKYTSRVSQPLQSTLMSVCDHNKYSETNSEKIFANIISEYNSNIPSPTPTSQRSMIPLPLEPLVN